VRDLFADVPARLKFLKTRATEAGHCLHLLEQYALAYPEVRFAATSDGRQAFASPGDGSLFGALVAVYGIRVAEQMVPFGGADEGPARDRRDHGAAGGADGERPHAHGYISLPSCYRSTRQCLSFFVNRRWVQSRTLTYAVEEAYHSLLLAGRHPVAVVEVALDPALLDVNVHPAKTEVKFLRERLVYATVQRAVRAALVANAAIPEVAAGALAVPGWSAPAGAPDVATEVAEGDADNGAPAAPRADALWGADGATDAGGAGAAPARGAAGGFAVPGVAPAGPVGGARLPVLRVLGQVSQAYIVTEGPDGVYLVDQHAAHERVLLGRMVAEWRARSVATQPLLEPLPLEVAPAEREAIEERLDALRALGFELEPFGEDALLLRAVPGALAGQAFAQPLRELLLELAGGGDAAARHGETWEEHALANVACKAAIKAGQTLSPEEQRELIRQLEATEGRQSCCHGRPTMVHLSLDALERQFDRR
jgi:DNA mismatch repair protein MutL